MEIAILILLGMSLLVSILSGIVLVRFRESYEREAGQLKGQVKQLSKELMIRLPPRPYGLDSTDNPPFIDP